MRLEIQGLRAVAVSFVLLYHLWESTFTSGFLGVDIFFVISSYLMAMLLTKKMRFEISTISDFYYRRLKRIVPLFLFVVFCTLICCIFLLAPVEFSNLSMDAIVSSTFTSNFLHIHDNGYFDLSDEFTLFKHTWSLAVELQFYLIVPFIFIAFGWLDKYHNSLKFVAIGLIAITSFVLQSIVSLNDGHMKLQYRLWQFMAGFIAFYSNQAQLLAPNCLYEKLEDIKDEKKAAGIQLILCAFVAAYLVEKLYKFIGTFITSWVSLYFVLIISYGLVVSCIFYVCRMKTSISYDHYMPLEEQTNTRSQIQQFYTTRNNDSILYSREEVANLDLKIHIFSQRFYACENATRYVPTKYNANLAYLSWFCHDKGMGNKNIVIIGNSHGRELWHGVKQNFRNVYKSLTLFVRDYCMPFLSKRARLDMRTVCQENENQILPILRNWNEPIDIIIVGLEYFDFFDPSLEYPNDEYMNEMQKFFTSLEKIAKDVVFIPRMHMDWKLEPFAQILQKQLHFQLNLNIFQQSLQKHEDYLSNVQKRIEMINCTKCIKVQWSNAWCSNEICRALDNKNLTQFRDSKHISSYGSLVYGKMLYELYDQYLINK